MGLTRGVALSLGFGLHMSAHRFAPQKGIPYLLRRLMNNSLPIERYNRLVQTMEDQQNEYLIQLSTLLLYKSEYAQYLDFGLSFLADVNTYYEQASPETKKRIIGSIFPEKLTFDGTAYRTTRVNEVFALICNGDKGLRKRKPGKKAGQSYQAPQSGLEPETL